MTEKVQTAEPATTRGRLWHAAANGDEHARAMTGESFRTRCGQIARRTSGGKRTPRTARELPPMESCVVCRLTPSEVRDA